ncbi:MAG: PspC domain-containing protein [Flavobacteriales bacterium]|nr:PspC domain-containing protein [Flavobacteriales bacterium]MCB9203932.1 PspC domain-containing protein [Flavobacteriales bacterium]
MNKTITSNIAGYVFHIDENAYEKLDAYLNTIRSYFKDSQGRDEILTDIEARLAEMLHERMSDAKHVISMEDVNQVIAVMGQPEAFLGDDPEESEWSEQRTSKSSTSGPRRLFRDPDNRVMAGICSGITHYLGLGDPIWLRLLFVLALFLSFGTALIAYVILYMIIPEATTTTDKLQMRGESVTVSNIERRVNEELEAVKGKWNEFHGESGAGRKVGDFVHRFFTLIMSLLGGVIKFFGKIFGLAFLVFGALAFLSILAVPFGMPTMISIGNDGVISSVEAQTILHNLVGGTGMMWLIYTCGILVWGVPLLALAYLGTRLLFGFRSRIKGVGISLVLLWILGVVMSFGVTMVVMSDFSSQGTDTESVELSLNSDPQQVINLDLNHELGEDEPDIEADIFNLNLVTAGNSTKLYGRPQFDINMAKTGGPKLVIKRLARAKKKQDAVERASKINYGFATTDTSVLLNGYFEIPEDELWRSQEVELELLLPVGYTVYLSEDLERIIYDIDNTTNTYDGDMIGRRWIMTPDGLTCVDCEGIETKETSEDIGDMLERELEEKQRILEKEQERLEREMEKRQEELEKIQEKLEQQIEEEEEMEEASNSPREILLRRVINASYKVGPSIYRNVQISYPG